MEIFYVSILFVSIAFAIVAIYLSFVLKRVANMVKTLGTSLGELERELEYMTPHLTKTLNESSKLVDDIREKINATDSVFDSAENVGKSVISLNEVYDEKSKQLSEQKLEQKMKPFVAGMTWSEVAIQLFSKWQKGTKEKNELMVQHTEVVPVNTGKEGSR
ncbi:DUF948 domain-containing protein [Oceanobacillus profundus]|uniref:DUF948 domain-containing protein n=1 Tax=Oceanobacillus profundus TaxID=372463 RepID=A0A417YC56_9BACI|nr:DUF948 domain-containing protein [Oceanobacillus profundus]MBR3120400.1 DUF948 domain-containing protein [Oceanobacillus sp.]PAE27617.1 general stress protein [Paenibacillus sp. 7884-2]MCM3399578.1 DUF948 domain-containing protein [Oceanobacillus profundus]MDO6450949.1 DUF948 domain-containing protein [Oceanobacillus profundus]RHW30269.1 DUF948 domain-containing protein [Oceanobacillus profundus]